MSATTYHTAITDCLAGLGYREIPENKTVEETAMSYNNKSYYLVWAGTNNLTYFTSDRLLYTHLFNLEIRYKHMNSLEQITNADAFLTLLDSISELSGFMGFMDEGRMERIDNRHSKATLTILIGAETNC